MSLGETAWNAYRDAVGGTTYDDRPLPEWSDLGDRQRAGWEAAASAVVLMDTE